MKTKADKKIEKLLKEDFSKYHSNYTPPSVKVFLVLMWIAIISYIAYRIYTVL